MSPSSHIRWTRRRAVLSGNAEDTHRSPVAIFLSSQCWMKRSISMSHAGSPKYFLDPTICLRSKRLRAVRLAFDSARSRSVNRSEEHTSELQSLMRISYAVFCLKQKKTNHYTHT